MIILVSAVIGGLIVLCLSEFVSGLKNNDYLSLFVRVSLGFATVICFKKLNIDGHGPKGLITVAFLGCAAIMGISFWLGALWRKKKVERK